jgi:hypothetical protein
VGWTVFSAIFARDSCDKVAQVYMLGYKMSMIPDFQLIFIASKGEKLIIEMRGGIRNNYILFLRTYEIPV